MIDATDFSDIPLYSALDIDRLPSGAISYVMIDLIHDGLGRPSPIPLIVIRGSQPGPVFGVSSTLHGNELNGIPVIHKLAQSLKPRTLKGTVVLAPVLNVPGFLRNQRKYRDGTDLNHVMPGGKHGNESQVFAHRLIERVISKLDYLVDLHTASFGRINSLYVRADMSHDETAKMALLQRPQIILDNPPSDRTLRGAAAGMGIPAFTIEIGDPQIFQPKHIRSTLAGIRAVLCHLGMTKKKPLEFEHDPVICSSSKWLYTDHGGLLEVLPKLSARVEKGELIATQKDIFGGIVREYLAPNDGIIIGKSVNPVSPTGARIVHLGKVAPEKSS